MENLSQFSDADIIVDVVASFIAMNVVSTRKVGKGRVPLKGNYNENMSNLNSLILLQLSSRLITISRSSKNLQIM